MVDAPDALIRVNGALDGLAAALESGDPEAVLAAEIPVASAVHALQQIDLAQVNATPDLALAILNTRFAVERCIALGRTGADLLAIVAGDPGYGPRGRLSAPSSPTLEARS